MSLSEEIERFRVEALGRVYQDLEIIEGVTGYVRDMDDVRRRFADQISQIVARGPEVPQGAPLAPWPVNDQSPTGYPAGQPAGLGPPPGYMPSDAPYPYAPPPPPPGYYDGQPNGGYVNGNGQTSMPPPPAGMPTFMGKEPTRR